VGFNFEAAGECLDVGVDLVRLCLPEAHDLDLFRVRVDLLLLGVDLLEDLSVHDLRIGTPVTAGTSRPRNKVGDDQDDVLGNLRPGDGLHAAEHGADQDAAEATNTPMVKSRFRNRLMMMPTPVTCAMR